MDGPNDRMDNYRHTHLDKIRKKKHSHMIKKEKMGQVKPRLQFQYHAKLVHQNYEPYCKVAGHFIGGHRIGNQRHHGYWKSEV